ncbi:TPA: hypothetical protein ACSP4D_001351, partial [Aeromonas veronii]
KQSADPRVGALLFAPSAISAPADPERRKPAISSALPGSEGIGRHRQGAAHTVPNQPPIALFHQRNIIKNIISLAQQSG